MSPDQKYMFDVETGNDRRKLLENMTVVLFTGTIEDALAGMDARGNKK
jgi:hypothetical protein